MEIPFNKKEVKFPGVIKKKSRGISMTMGLRFCLALEIPMDVVAKCEARFCGISRGEASFCLEFPMIK